MTTTKLPISQLPKVYYTSNGGELICSHHAGAYLTAALTERPNGRKFTTPLGVWERLSSVEVAMLFAEIGFCCETCKANEPTPIGDLNDSHIGKFVTLQSKRHGSVVSGVYVGNEQSKWDGGRMHYFRGGIIGVTPQGNGLHGFPVARTSDMVLIKVEDKS